MRIDNPSISGSLSFIQGTNTISGTSVSLTGSLSGTFEGQFSGDSLTNISGAFDSVSSSLASDISLNASSVISLNSLTGSLATQTYVTTALNNLIDAAPASLDTLNELAAALNDDANFATTVTNSLATKLNLSGGNITGNLSVDTNVLFVDTVNDRVGIGTSSPLHKLDIVDGVQIRLANSTTGTTTTDGTRIYLSGNDFFIVNRESANIQIYTTDTERMRITSAGNVGIGTTSPRAPFAVNGTLMAGDHGSTIAILSGRYSSFSGGNEDIPVTFGSVGSTFIPETYIVTITAVIPNISSSRRFVQSVVQITRNNASASAVVHNLHNISSGSPATVIISAESITTSGFTLRSAFSGGANATILVQACSFSGFVSI